MIQDSFITAAQQWQKLYSWVVPFSDDLKWPSRSFVYCKPFQMQYFCMCCSVAVTTAERVSYFTTLLISVSQSLHLLALWQSILLCPCILHICATCRLRQMWRVCSTGHCRDLTGWLHWCLTRASLVFLHFICLGSLVFIMIARVRFSLPWPCGWWRHPPNRCDRQFLSC